MNDQQPTRAEMLEQLEGVDDQALARALAAAKASPPRGDAGQQQEEGPPREYPAHFFPGAKSTKPASVQAREERGGGGSYA